MDEKMREYLESRDKLATEACEQLRKVIYAFMDLQDELKKRVDEDEKYDGASSADFIFQMNDYKNLRNRILMAEYFLANGPFCEEEEPVEGV